MKKAEETRVVSFRVPESQWQKFAELAAARGAENVNEWCRNVALERLSTGDTFTKNERLIYEELARVRYLVGYGFGMLADDTLTPEEWEAKRQNADGRGAEIAQVLLDRQRAKSG
jgi:hypothetical protein